MNGLALGGSHGIFSHPGKALGNIFSLKNVVPDLTATAGAVIGSFIMPGVGTAIGAGLGEAAGEKIEGKSWEQSALSGVEAGTLVYGGEELAGAGAAGAVAGAAGTEGAGAAGTGTIVGNAINAAGDYVGLSGGTVIGNAINEAGTYVLGSGAGTGTILGNDVNALGSNIGLGGSNMLGGAINSAGTDIGLGTQSTALTGGVVSNPALTTALESSGTVAGPAGYGITQAAGTAAGTAASGGGGLFTARNLLSAGELGLDVLRGNQPVKGENQVNTEAAQFAAQGQTLQNYITSGQLPAGAQATINQAVAAQQAAIRSQYASMGMTGSSAEAQDLAGAQMQGVQQATSLAQQLLQTGVQESEFSTQLYQDIMNDNIQKDNALGSAIGNFAVSMIPGGSSTAGGTSPTPGSASSLASANAA